VFVVVLSDEGQQLVAPRAVGPFDDYDHAQACANTLTSQWAAESGEAPTATVVHVEEPLPGVVIGEL
jgi:hypothetical protein